MLQNASLLAIVAVDTAENEPSEVGDGGTAALSGPACSQRYRSPAKLPRHPPALTAGAAKS